MNNDDGGTAPCSRIHPGQYPAAANLPVGTYYVRVERVGNNATQAQYVLSIKVNPPGCGDEILQPTEQCEDGNTTSGDGCSQTCASESPFEIEPNGALPTASPLWPSTMTWKGAITPLGDHDYFRFTLGAVGSPTLVTHDRDSPMTCAFDTVIHLLDGNGVQIAQDDDSGPGSCSAINPVLFPQVQSLPAGQYFLWVQRFDDSQTIAGYQPAPRSRRSVSGRSGAAPICAAPRSRKRWLTVA